MDSDSNTGPAGSTQIQYRYIGKYKRVTQYKYRVRRVNSPAAAKNLSAELLPIPHQATAGVTAMMKIMKSTKIERYMSQLLLLGKFEYGGGPIFKVVLEC